MLEINSCDLVALLLGSSGAKAAAGAGLLAQPQSGGAGEFAAELLPLLAAENEEADAAALQVQPPRGSLPSAGGFWRMAQPAALLEAGLPGQSGTQSSSQLLATETPLPLRERLLLLLQRTDAAASAPNGALPSAAEALQPAENDAGFWATLRQVVGEALASILASGAKAELESESEQLAASLKAQLAAVSGGTVTFEPGAEVKLPAGLAEALAAALSGPSGAASSPTIGGATVAAEPSAGAWTMVQAVPSQGRQFQLWAAPAANTATSAAIAAESTGALKLQIALVEANAQTGTFKPLLSGLLAVQPAPVASSEPALAQPIAVASAAPAAMAEGFGAPRSPAAARQSASVLAAALVADAPAEAKPTPLRSASSAPSGITPGELKPAASAERPLMPEPAAQAVRQSEAALRAPVSANSAAVSDESADEAAVAGKPARQTSVDPQPRTVAAYTDLSFQLRQFAAPAQRVALPQLAQFIADYAAQASAGLAPRQVVVSVSPPDLGEVVIQLSESADGLHVLLKSGAAGSSTALREHLPVLVAQLAAADVPVRNIEVAETGGQRQGGSHQGQHHGGSGQEQQPSREDSRQQQPHQRTPREELEAAMKQAAESARNHIGLSPFN